MKSFARFAIFWGTALAAGLLAGCASDDTPPPFHSSIKMDRVPDSAVANADLLGRTNLTISDWETNHPYQGVGAGGGSAVGGTASGSGSSGPTSGSAAGTVGIGSATSTGTTTLGTTSGRTTSGTVTNSGAGLLTPLPPLTTPSQNLNNTPTFGLPATNSFGRPR